MTSNVLAIAKSSDVFILEGLLLMVCSFMLRSLIGFSSKATCLSLKDRVAIFHLVLYDDADSHKASMVAMMNSLAMMIMITRKGCGGHCKPLDVSIEGFVPS
jgi:hypothetical protein